MSHDFAGLQVAYVPLQSQEFPLSFAMRISFLVLQCCKLLNPNPVTGAGMNIVQAWPLAHVI